MIFKRRIAEAGGGFPAGLALALLMAAPGVADAAEAATGKVAEVVLYRGQAKVVRVIDLAAGQGPVEMVVTNLPEHVVGSSLYAESTAGVDVRAVRYRQRAVGEAPREEVRALDEKIEAQQDLVKLNQQMQQLVASQLKYLDRMEGFIAPTANADLRRGVLKTEALEKITLFSFKKREDLANRSVDLKKKMRALKSQAQLLARQRSQIAGGASRSVHEAILFLDKRVAGPQKLRLTYLVGNCAWTPAYNFRADSKRKRVAIEYNALIQQMSGEDWTNVKLTLSTASPTLSAAAPALGAFQVSLVSVAGQSAAKGQQATSVREQVKQLQARQRVAEQQTSQAFTQQGNFDASWSLNRGASDYQLLELANPKHELATLQSDPEEANNGPSLSYEIAAAVNLASRRDQQMVRILGDELGTDLYHVATPVLTSQVYREAELTNTTAEDLLRGTVNVYLDDRFVGRTEITTVARGQTFVVGFGADPQLRTSRELLDRTQSKQGGNQVIAFRYRVVVESYTDAELTVRVQDRTPYLNTSEQLRVTLGEMTDKLSDDAVYLRLERPRGILRWDIAVPAGSSGEKARMVEYGYRIEFDRNFHLRNPTGANAQQQQKEYEDLFRQKNKR